MLELCHHVRCTNKKQHDDGDPFAVIPPHLTPRLGVSNGESNEESQNIHATKSLPDKLRVCYDPSSFDSSFGAFKRRVKRGVTEHPCNKIPPGQAPNGLHLEPHVMVYMLKTFWLRVLQQRYVHVSPSLVRLPRVSFSFKSKHAALV